MECVLCRVSPFLSSYVSRNIFLFVLIYGLKPDKPGQTIGLTASVVHSYLSVFLTVTHYTLLIHFNIICTRENFLLSTHASTVYIAQDIV